MSDCLYQSYSFNRMISVRFNVQTVSATHRDYPGLEQSGLPMAIASSIAALPEELRGMFWANIGLIGGCTKLPGFAARLWAFS